ncbi:MAG: MFS transporter, partial [Elusimicrobia bacterium]|nr:MFS transporter [Elusimicrobiota bacterium]
FLPVRTLILMLALTSLVGAPYGVLLPIVAGRVLRGGPHTLGFLMAASGAGALSGALWLASRRSVLGLGRTVLAVSFAFAAALGLFAQARSLWQCLPLMVVMGGCLMLQFASINTIIQTIVDDEKRGRVMSFYLMAFMGAAPFGSLLAGGLASRVGTAETYRLMALACLLGSWWFARRLPALREAIHPVYRRMGILPPVARALEAAAELSVPPEEA